MPQLDLTFESGESSLSVRRFSVHEAVSVPFTVSIWARSPNPAIDLTSLTGKAAGFVCSSGFANLTGAGSRSWNGVCSYVEQVRGERRPHANEQSLYYLRISPTLWLLNHRRGTRIFQHVSIPDIVAKILGEWSIPNVLHVVAGAYPKHEYRVQYGETDFSFMSRLLEEAGIGYTFDEDGSSLLTFADKLEKNPKRGGPPIPYEENPTAAAEREYISRVALSHDETTGLFTMRDYDFRRPAYDLLSKSKDGPATEAKNEHYLYVAGGTYVEGGAGGDTPVADDQAVVRHAQAYGDLRAGRWLESLRTGKRAIAFETNVNELLPGVVFAMQNHPHPELGADLLTIETVHEGSAEGEWVVLGRAVFVDVPYRPPIVTPKPDVRGVMVARVVGPYGEEIHTDEFGRVRVQFPWDRDGKYDDHTTCWMRVGEGWGGEAYGFIDIPRVGHEVLVTFLGGDPDRPVVAGRVYNPVNPVPYVLPDHKTVSTWKSHSYPHADGGWFNELKFEDLAGSELFYWQAQKNLRALVKHDESITVGHDRSKTVVGEEQEVTGVMRTQIVVAERSALTSVNQTEVVHKDKLRRVIKDEREVTQSNRELLVKLDQDVVVKGNRRERVEYDRHMTVVGNRVEHVEKTHSLTVLESRAEKVGETFSRESGNEMHVVAGHDLCGEAPSVTLKGPGGFITIDASGIAIVGTMVLINVSGSPGHGHGSHPVNPDDAVEATIPTGSLWKTGPGQGQAISAALEETLATLEVVSQGLGPTAVALIKLAMSHDVSSPRDGAIFWSGGATLACVAAQQLAAERGIDHPSVSLELTSGGSLLGATCAGVGKDEVSKPGGVDWTEQNPAWRIISQRFARGASGDVHVVVGKVPVGANAILREESKLLAANKNVTSVTFWAVKHEGGKPVTDAAGHFVLEPTTAAAALATPEDPRKTR
ncbi:MAG TPA: type VI secretion system tip protein TssI/VgrG [Byssovorax sp.]|jgi:type VI secretion system secreted protein VgrG